MARGVARRPKKENDKNMSDVVVVLGMHRSGTSAVAGALTKLGGGPPKHLMAADPSNARGFFKSVPFMHFHDELLASAGTDWRDWRLFNPGWIRSPVAADFRRRAKDLFVEEFNGSALPVLKDPRICRFTPFWLNVLRDMRATPHIAMPIRSPLDVAESLKNVHGLSLTHGLLLWLRHVLDAESQSRSVARSIFTRKAFQSDWRGVCDKIAAETHLSWPRLSDRAAREIDRFLAKELVHHDTDDAALVAHADVHEWTLRAYEALLELARNPLSNSALATLDDISALLDQSSKLFGRVLIDCEVDLEDARGEARAASGERDALRSRHNEMLAEKAAALAELAAREEQAERAREEAAREKDALAQALAAALAERDASNAAHAGAAAELQARQRDLDEFASLSEEIEAALGEAERDKEGLSRTLAAAVAERDALSARQAQIAAELQARQRELAEKAAALAELAARAEEAEAGRGEAGARRRRRCRARSPPLPPNATRFATPIRELPGNCRRSGGAWRRRGRRGRTGGRPRSGAAGGAGPRPSRRRSFRPSCKARATSPRRGKPRTPRRSPSAKRPPGANSRRAGRTRRRRGGAGASEGEAARKGPLALLSPPAGANPPPARQAAHPQRPLRRRILPRRTIPRRCRAPRRTARGTRSPPRGIGRRGGLLPRLPPQSAVRNPLVPGALRGRAPLRRQPAHALFPPRLARGARSRPWLPDPNITSKPTRTCAPPASTRWPTIRATAATRAGCRSGRGEARGRRYPTRRARRRFPASGRFQPLA